MRTANIELTNHFHRAGGAQRIARRALDDAEATSAHGHLRARTQHRAHTTKSDKN